THPARAGRAPGEYLVNGACVEYASADLAAEVDEEAGGEVGDIFGPCDSHQPDLTAVILTKVGIQRLARGV
ncbi:MAG TPA: hypothetical protein VEH04_01120, partial [Verrucomicrobiae bacterium]|nr:hypothetical protein [Verrucomicrobiae bacterium]